MADRFRYYFRVRYGDCDAQKVVFSARYGAYADISTLEFLRALGYGEAVATGTLDYSVVKQTMMQRSSRRSRLYSGPLSLSRQLMDGNLPGNSITPKVIRETRSPMLRLNRSLMPSLMLCCRNQRSNA
jgi:hypothetical protein